MKNPRNWLVGDISDRWKIGRKDRHGPHTVSFILSKERGKLSLYGVGAYCMKNRYSDCTTSLVLRSFFLRDFTWTRLKIYTTFRIYAINFGLKLYGRHDPWPLLSCVEG